MVEIDDLKCVLRIVLNTCPDRVHVWAAKYSFLIKCSNYPIQCIRTAVQSFIPVSLTAYFNVHITFDSLDVINAKRNLVLKGEEVI